MNIKYNCKHFKGNIPCLPNKLRDQDCRGSCDDYIEISKKILIIKLGARGDVLRTTPLLRRYKSIYPDAQFTWVTLYPEVLPDNEIDIVYKFNGVTIFSVLKMSFDIAINLDKDIEVCLFFKEVNSKEKYGFTAHNGHIYPQTSSAKHKILTGLFDDFSKKNTKSYLEEIFEICHLKFNYEEYYINVDESLKNIWGNTLLSKSSGKEIIGLNTGSGKRWLTRQWTEEKWIRLINLLQRHGFFVMVLGGKDEDEQNLILSTKTGCYYPGTFSIKEFIALSDSCDIIVSQVTFMMHVAIGLKKKLVLLNNIFNVHEFEMYGRGSVIQPDSGCDCYYEPFCGRPKSCMHDITAKEVFNHIIDKNI
ncbi:glycosyltransferase family 9 protein (plasmid) [Flammeovirga sp. MY04]|uniref:glycosyltransferase family 9 protein n=1 Tax=Flammeovirga sp. MY04 TaxID=1191459 RepID=UPI0008061C1C|nr:glycosyltransferase family 9 protein [Flammeovirga sp. MY04]ANQ52870.1 glycosyltransferase family 9 protein [Flammeovirga sp. MY04]